MIFKEFLILVFLVNVLEYFGHGKVERVEIKQNENFFLNSRLWEMQLFLLQKDVLHYEGHILMQLSRTRCLILKRTSQNGIFVRKSYV